MFSKANINYIAIAVCLLALTFSLFDNVSNFPKEHKIQELKRGLICLFVAFVLYKLGNLLEDVNELLGLGVSLIGLCFFFPFSIVFFHAVSPIVSTIMILYIIYAVILASRGGSWDGRGPDEGDD